MASNITPTSKLEWFTPELQAALLEASKNGLKTEWVARFCGVAPQALVTILDLGARRDAQQPFRRFFRQWMDRRTALMKSLHDRWIELGDGGAHNQLKELWPQVYGKDAKPDHDPFERSVTHAEELAQLEAIIENPWSFGDDIGEMFRKHGRLKPDGS